MTRDTGGHGSPEPLENDQGAANTGVEYEDRSGAARVIVVGVDAARLVQYRAALGLAEVPIRTTLDTHEAETLIAEHPLEVLVLDLGLPRLALLQLYGHARSAEGGDDVQVLFVGQDGDTGPDDHFLPGEPSPVTVASWVSDLLAGVPEAPSLDLGPGAGPAVGAAAAADRESSGSAGRDHAAGDRDAPATDADVPAVNRTGADDAPAASTADSDAAELDAPPPVIPAPAAVDGVPPSEGASTPTAVPVPASSRRLHVAVVRIGLVLLLLGALLILVRLEWNPPTTAPPDGRPAPAGEPDATPAPAGLRLSLPPDATIAVAVALSTPG